MTQPRLITHNGQTLSIPEWAKKLGLSDKALYYRINELGLPTEEALSLPKNYNAHSPRPFYAKKYWLNGKQWTILELSEAHGIPYNTLYRRLCGKDKQRKKWTVKQAITTKVGATTERLITYQGKTQSLTKWAKEVGLSADLIRQRLDRLAWGTERALTTPIQSHKNNPGIQRLREIREISIRRQLLRKEFGNKW